MISKWPIHFFVKWENQFSSTTDFCSCDTDSNPVVAAAIENKYSQSGSYDGDLNSTKLFTSLSLLQNQACVFNWVMKQTWEKQTTHIGT